MKTKQAALAAMTDIRFISGVQQHLPMGASSLSFRQVSPT
eukprot:CAMPEP_0114523772 /NCGR_PEP_ID=MMETSP0109-20121206/21474_1 /TAXON_ID=29199 /ORGANISM="Chlorarachnion reptans, Strain CCCM449" /LENGTH=39 /DNA_ID= /DNA_START= /DNA_END= /DNA_ORIENTATION=